MKCFSDLKVLMNKSIAKTVIVTFFAELLGTGILLFMGCTGCITNAFTPFIPQFASMSYGFAVMLSIHVVGHLSGSHINPAVTIAAAIVGEIKIYLVPIYFLGQFAGAFAGYGLLYMTVPKSWVDPVNGLCTTKPHPDLTVTSAFFLEFLFTGLLVLLVCSVWNPKITGQSDSAVIRIGLILCGIFMVLGPLTGASLNSARTLAPAVFTNVWNAHWIYWVAPNSAAAITAVIYRVLFMSKDNSDDSDEQV